MVLGKHLEKQLWKHQEHFLQQVKTNQSLGLMALFGGYIHNISYLIRNPDETARNVVYSCLSHQKMIQAYHALRPSTPEQVHQALKNIPLRLFYFWPFFDLVQMLKATLCRL